jgi:hypothetical protein
VIDRALELKAIFCEQKAAKKHGEFSPYWFHCHKPDGTKVFAPLLIEKAAAFVSGAFIFWL